MNCKDLTLCYLKFYVIWIIVLNLITFLCNKINLWNKFLLFFFHKIILICECDQWAITLKCFCELKKYLRLLSLLNSDKISWRNIFVRKSVYFYDKNFVWPKGSKNHKLSWFFLILKFLFFIFLNKSFHVRYHYAT